MVLRLVGVEIICLCLVWQGMFFTEKFFLFVICIDTLLYRKIFYTHPEYTVAGACSEGLRSTGGTAPERARKGFEA